MHTLTSVLLALGLWSAIAIGAPISFVQDGWSPGGPLKISFSGEDANADGTLELLELGSFHAAWITPDGEVTEWALPDIESDGFLFTGLDNYLFFTTNPEYSLVSTAFEGEGLSSVFDKFLFPVSSSGSPVSAVPEPSGLCLLGMTVLSLWRAARWRKTRRR